MEFPCPQSLYINQVQHSTTVIHNWLFTGGYEWTLNDLLKYFSTETAKLLANIFYFWKRIRTMSYFWIPLVKMALYRTSINPGPGSSWNWWGGTNS